MCVCVIIYILCLNFYFKLGFEILMIVVLVSLFRLEFINGFRYCWEVGICKEVIECFELVIVVEFFVSEIEGLIVVFGYS